MRTPRGVDVEVSARCNLSCRYCCHFDHPSVEYRDLPADEWIRFFDELGACAVTSICLTGGEPFLRPDLRGLIQRITANRMRFSVLSNGVLLDDATAAFLAATGRCDYVQVSVDGSHAGTHDSCRGRGSFEGALRGIRILRRHGVPVTARVTLHRLNVDDLEAIARLLLVELELPSFSVNAAGYLGSCRQGAADVLLTVADRQRAMEILLRLSGRYVGRILAQAGPLAEARRWRLMENARAKGEPPFADGGRLTGCGCMNRRMAVRADGAFIPCLLLADMPLGRINRDPLIDVWLHHPLLNRFRRRRFLPLTGFAFCSGCDYIPYCTGNCPGVACALTGDVDRPSPDACLRRFLAGGGKIPAGTADDRAADTVIRSREGLP